jgi:alcohol dehydrogenase (cytochrome c)
MSWNPITGLAYISGENSVAFYTAADDRPGLNASRASRRFEVPRFDDPPGFLVAWDPVLQQPRWRVSFDTMFNGGTLTTAGGLVFAADFQGQFSAFDASSGEVLWTYDVGPGPATPVTYEVAEQQFVTVLSGERVWTFGLAPR